MMDKLKAYKIGRTCCMCDNDLWIDATKMHNQILMKTLSCSSCSYTTMDDRFIGVGHGNKELCIPCLLILTGMEDYFDVFYFDLLDNIKAKSMLNKIRIDKDLLASIGEYVGNGKYIPNKILEALDKGGR